MLGIHFHAHSLGRCVRERETDGSREENTLLTINFLIACQTQMTCSYLQSYYLQSYYSLTIVSLCVVVWLYIFDGKPGLNDGNTGLTLILVWVCVHTLACMCVNNPHLPLSFLSSLKCLCAWPSEPVNIPECMTLLRASYNHFEN